ncbi:MAG: hypothetical protein JWN56_2024 [Sphingobacteriales bacterium]|nr:hypothetical protein [Sphingobacteriales bacterium]
MKLTFFTLNVFLFFLISNVEAKKPPEQIIGKWISEEGDFIVDIYKVGNKFNAKLIWFDATDTKLNVETATDYKNPDADLRNRKLIGIEVLQNLIYNIGNNKYEDGTIYDASTGRAWTAYAFFNHKNLLIVKAYWQFKFISQTLTLKRYCTNQIAGIKH